MNVLINDQWFYAIEIAERENTIGVEIPKGSIDMFNGIFDDAHRTHGKAIFVSAPYAFLHQEPTEKGKMTSKCKIGHYTNCVLTQIHLNYHKDLAYAFFVYQNKVEKC